MKNKVSFIALIAVIALMFNAVTLIGQDLTKKKIIHYLIKVGDLGKNAMKDKYVLKGGFYAVNLITRENYKDGQNGVFEFGTYCAHCKSYLFLKDSSSFIVLNMRDLDTDLLSEIAFLKKNKFSSDEILKYIKSTIKLDQINKNTIRKAGFTIKQ